MIGRETTDRQWMRRALRLAKQAWGRTTPNPMVGAVVVKNGICVGEGFHPQAGALHAERFALAAAGKQAKGATLYVTLEPCCTHGRTPPCTEAVIAAGIKRVVIGVVDPNPRHAARGLKLLREAGIEVDCGILEAECAALNEAFFYWIRHRRPFVLLKLAMTLDGRIATAGGESRWITGVAARREVQRLRQWCDAIMVGGETVRQDDPGLTVREPADWPQQPRKIVWSRRPLSEFPVSLKLWADPRQRPQFACLDTPVHWQRFLEDMGKQDVTALLLEGGGELAAAALRAGAVDKVAFFIAPKILGGRGSRAAVAGRDPLSLAEAIGIRDLKVRRVGNDLLLTGYPGHAPVNLEK
jgi:diaminohydroxyphosphoribosylaminopyrimidine deaminase/5-amino-6-(5-phosphoribosylamino)uracil reductase